MNHFLADSTHIDYRDPEVLQQAMRLSGGLSSDMQITRTCFEFVRDEIKHSFDHFEELSDKTTTCSASDVLRQGHGFCYAKSHLLAALLRANNIPAALCYQRLVDDEDAGTYCLHGLNAVSLDGGEWLRLDARGDNARLHTQFQPPQQSLAYAGNKPGEFTFSEFWSTPLPQVVTALSQGHSYKQLANALPDRLLSA